MGDLMDEGSVATSSDYGKYMERFAKVFPFDETKIEVMHIPGDNDIGGERTDVVTKFKVHRFEMAFKEKRTLDLKNFVRLLNVNLITHQYPTLEEYPSDFELPEYTNIIVTHISLLSYMGMFSERVSEVEWSPTVVSFWLSAFPDHHQIQAKRDILCSPAHIPPHDLSADSLREFERQRCNNSRLEAIKRPATDMDWDHGANM